MVKVPSKIKTVLEDYLLELAKEIKISSAFLFGSYAEGVWDKDSDIDIAVFSPDFAKVDRFDSGFFLLKKTRIKILS